MKKDKRTYKILRYYYKDGKKPKVIAVGRTFNQARAHCDDPKTMRPGVWVDGFTKEK